MTGKRILLIEDDENKLNQVVDFLGTIDKTKYLDVARSLNKACRLLDGHTFDLILLDMTLPTFDGGKTASAAGRQKPLGGKEILQYMWECEIQAQVYVLSQFKDFPEEADKVIGLDILDQQLRRDFPTLYQNHIYFEHKSNGWKEELKRILEIVN